MGRVIVHAPAFPPLLANGGVPSRRAAFESAEAATDTYGARTPKSPVRSRMGRADVEQRQTPKSMRSGFSTQSLMCTRKPTASAPSMIRWS